jgi:hypothetical protein
VTTRKSCAAQPGKTPDGGNGNMVLPGQDADDNMDGMMYDPQPIKSVDPNGGNSDPEVGGHIGQVCNCTVIQHCFTSTVFFLLCTFG